MGFRVSLIDLRRQITILTDIKANALNTSACVFEAIYEVDTKFSKIADKEVDALTDDIKKWFKKLAVRTISCSNSSCIVLVPLS